MSYKQTKTPNLNAFARAGWCLEYVQNAFKSNWAGSSAWDAWSNRVAHRHANSNFPANVYVIIWFSGTWDGHYYGHVAILNTRTGQVYTSPYFKSTGVEVYNSINAMVSVFRNAMPDIRYVGWSKDIGGIKVIERVSKVSRIPDANNYYWRYGQRLSEQVRGRHLSREEFRRHIVGQTDLRAVEILSDDKEADKVQNWQTVGKLAVQDKWQQQIYDLQAQVKALGSRPTKAQLDAANKKAGELAKQMEEAQKVVELEKKRAEEVEAKLKAAEEEQAKSKREADNFLTALINVIRSKFGGK